MLLRCGCGICWYRRIKSTLGPRRRIAHGFSSGNQDDVGRFSFEVRLSWPLIVLILSSHFLGGHSFFQVCLRERHESKAFWKTCWNPQEPKVYVFVTSLARSCVCCRELLDAPHGDQCSHASNGQLDGDWFTDLLKELKTDWLNTKSTGHHYLLLFRSSNSDKVLFACWSFVDVHQILNYSYLCNWSSSVDSVVIFYLSKRKKSAVRLQLAWYPDTKNVPMKSHEHD